MMEIECCYKLLAADRSTVHRLEKLINSLGVSEVSTENYRWAYCEGDTVEFCIRIKTYMHSRDDLDAMIKRAISQVNHGDPDKPILYGCVDDTLCK